MFFIEIGNFIDQRHVSIECKMICNRFEKSNIFTLLSYGFGKSNIYDLLS